MKVYKAQWPLSTNMGQPMVLIYDEPKRKEEYYLSATPEVRKTIFQDKYIRVYFRGRIEAGNVIVDRFVRRSGWL